MSKLILALMSTTVLLFSVPAPAAETSQAEADRLQQLFERYVSKPADGNAGIVSVVPLDGAYRVTLDLHYVLDLIPAAAATLDVPKIAFSLTPLQDGTWQVAMADRLKIDYTAPGGGGSYLLDRMMFDAIFDPAIAAFKSSTLTVPALAAAKVSSEATSEIEAHDLLQTATGTPGSNGTADIAITQTMSSLAETVRIGVPNPAKPQRPQTLNFDFKIAGDKTIVDVRGLRSKQLLDVWAYGVAHQGNAPKGGGDPGVTGPLLAALPVFDSLKLDSAVSGFTLNWIFGKVSASAYSAHFDATTQSPSSIANLEVKVDDLAISSGFFPEPARVLLPTKIDFSLGAKDFDFGNGVKTMVQVYDIDHHDPDILKKNDAQIRAAWLPTGKMEVVVPPSGISAPAYTIAFQGNVVLSQTHIKSHLDVRMSGFDEVTKVLAQVKAPGAPQLLVGLFAISALAKKEADGTLDWAIDADDGSFLVNGSPVGPQPKN